KDTRKDTTGDEQKKFDYMGKIFVPIIRTVVGGLILAILVNIWNSNQEEKKAQVNLSASEVYPYGTFERNLAMNGEMIYEIKPSFKPNEYTYAAENMVWVTNPSDENLMIDKGTFNIHSISELKEDDVNLRMIVGTSGSTLTIYIVNNTNTDFGTRYVRFSPHFFMDDYPIFSDEEMQKVFNTDNFEKKIDSIPSGSVFKVFKFELSADAQQKLEDNLDSGSYLFSVEHYENRSMREERAEQVNNNKFNPIYLYYKNNKLEYGYSSQGGSEEQPKDKNGIPVVYVDVKNYQNSEYPININSKIGNKGTTCLVQYIVPSHSCKIEYSVDFKINNEEINDDKKKINIKVPMYKLEEGIRVRNEKAFNLLEKNGNEKLSIHENNDFTEQLKYNPEEWGNDQLAEINEQE
ncbi:MAG: hypothetical protein ACLR1F_10510, partial [Enterococcus avium]